MPHAVKKTTPSASPSVRGLLAYLAVERGLSANTAAAYRADLEGAEAYLVETFGRTLADATPDDLAAYLSAESGRGMSTTTVSRRHAALKTLLKFQRANGRDVDRHLARIERPKAEDPLPKILSRGQVDRLIAAPDPADRLWARDVAMLELLYAAGLRATELCNLELRHVDLSERWVRVMGKGAKERVVPFNQAARDAVARYLADCRPRLLRRPTDRVFLSRTGRPMERVALWNLVERYGRKSGVLNGVSPHVLRHCFASHLLGGGADLRVIQELLGHTDVTTTQVYTHLDTTRLKATHAKFHPRG